MIYTKMTNRAIKLAYQAHHGQLDKSGLPYVFHPFHLAEQMKTEETVTVALLHDVVEDTDYSLEDLRKMGFSDGVLDALALMTHDPSVPYMEYIKCLKRNPIARSVKLADLTHNSDLSRLPVVTEKDLERAEKYRKAINLLEQGE
ncbi:MAG: bifunctional (p)ppGpp synthetase/guanosine-3',5'-bis(diphosphate) 3'-pyrophosphohydrolase [Oscillospiraceae bacterium]|nr:bifunctional (p)ppGpp synthetase/guanosine-3',5'-bis(diphosphate) 3'-pyrophosphohydrolase [Oscillospiraceae bacterium]